MPKISCNLTLTDWKLSTSCNISNHDGLWNARTSLKHQTEEGWFNLSFVIYHLSHGMIVYLSSVRENDCFTARRSYHFIMLCYKYDKGSIIRLFVTNTLYMYTQKIMYIPNDRKIHLQFIVKRIDMSGYCFCKSFVIVLTIAFSDTMYTLHISISGEIH